MIVKMKETAQGRDIYGTLRHEGIQVNVLEKGEEYIVDPVLGAWLVEQGKAEDITPAKSQPAPVVPVMEAEQAPVEESPVQHTGKRGRK